MVEMPKGWEVSQLKEIGRARPQSAPRGACSDPRSRPDPIGESEPESSGTPNFISFYFYFPCY